MSATGVHTITRSASATPRSSFVVVCVTVRALSSLAQARRPTPHTHDASRKSALLQGKSNGAPDQPHSDDGNGIPLSHRSVFLAGDGGRRETVIVADRSEFGVGRIRKCYPADVATV